MGGLVIGADLPLFKCSPFIMSGKSFQIWKPRLKMPEDILVNLKIRLQVAP